jgi:4-hydroxy-tetrahydrodipicolinate reductase
MIRLCLAGGLGRMGRTIASVLEKEDVISLVSIFETPEAVASAGDYGRAAGPSEEPVIVTSDAEEAVSPADLVVDFSLPPAFDSIVKTCVALSKPLVTGTTGIQDKQAKLRALAARVPVVSAPNMSIGMNVVFALCHRLADVMGKTSDLEIVETHHRGKMDVPSGTARELAEILRKHTGKEIVVGRPAGTSRHAGEIAIHSLRAGDVPGSHSILFVPEGETVEISHVARSRVCFAEGALRAVRFVMQAPPGLYDMMDVLGLRQAKEGRT